MSKQSLSHRCEDVDEAVFVREETGQLASPEREITNAITFARAKARLILLVLIAWETGIAVDIERNTDEDMRIVNPGEDLHQPRFFILNESLDRKLDINAEPVLNGQNLNRVVLSCLKDTFLPRDHSCRDSSGTLVYLSSAED